MFTRKTIDQKCLLIFLVLTLQLSINAQAGWWKWQNPRPQGNPLYAINFTDIKRGVAVGRDGVILKTSDGGKQWDVVRSPINTPLYGLALRGKKGTKSLVAVGSRGVVLISNNNGESWKAVESGTKKHLYAVSFIDEKRGWA
ncbi:MAG TPA: hypothetical protein VEF04_10660, partial [Blastocatellia bacterium]|nr:hypothetical protein [Blastocatellia bacterium]